MMRVFFCLNEVSYTLAREACRAPGFSLLVMMAERVRPRPTPRAVTVRFRAWAVLAVCLVSLLTRRVEVVIPHRRRPALRWVARCARRLAYVDDGMDTFRSVPRNIEPDQFVGRPRYYTFSYPFPVAGWVGGLQVVEVAPIALMESNDRPALSLQGYACLVLESPGVDLQEVARAGGNCFYLRHPSYLKNRPLPEGLPFASGLDCSAEKTMLAFPGDLVLGETMALVFALSVPALRPRIHVRLLRADYENLRCLHGVLAQCGSLRVAPAAAA